MCSFTKVPALVIQVTDIHSAVSQEVVKISPATDGEGLPIPQKLKQRVGKQTTLVGSA